MPFGIGSAIFLLLERGTRPSAPSSVVVRTGRAHVPSAEGGQADPHARPLGVDFLARTTDANALSQNLSDTATLLARIHDPDELLQAMAAKVAQAIGCDWAAVHLLRRGLARMQRVAIHGSNEARGRRARSRRGGGVDGRRFAGSPEGVLEISDVEALAKPEFPARGMLHVVVRLGAAATRPGCSAS